MTSLHNSCHVSIRINYSGPQSCHDKCTTAFYLENMYYAPTPAWWYGRLDVGCAYANLFLKDPNYEYFFPCQAQAAGHKTMAVAFEKPFFRGMEPTWFSNTCASFDVRMSVKIPSLDTSPYASYVTPMPKGDLSVN